MINTNKGYPLFAEFVGRKFLKFTKSQIHKITNCTTLKKVEWFLL